MLKKIGLGVIDGAVGTALLDNFDKNNDGKVSWSELKNASVDKWVRFIVSAGTSICTALYFS